MLPFLNIRFVDILDVFMVAVLVYYLYRMLKGTNIIRIFWALLIMYIAWRIFAALGMRFCSQILGGIMSIGLIALVIVFQPEIRKFLLFIGTKTQVTGDTLAKRLQFWRSDVNKHSGTNFEPYIQACMHMSQSKTGALIIFKRSNEVEELVRTGETINAVASSALIETLFFKNSPLHDGAVIDRPQPRPAPPQRHRRHRAARCHQRHRLRRDRSHLLRHRRRDPPRRHPRPAPPRPREIHQPESITEIRTKRNEHKRGLAAVQPPFSLYYSPITISFRTACQPGLWDPPPHSTRTK